MQSNATLLRLRLATLVAFSLVFAAMISGACVGAGLSTAGASGPSGGPDATIGGRVTAGPTCPVERQPPDPRCSPRPVAGAVLIVKDATGHEIVRATSTSSGTWTALVPPGTYTISAQPVGGLMGTPPTTTVTVIAGAHPEDVDLSYDTGIR